MDAAHAAGKRVYACAEAYAESLSLPDGIAMFGYFDCTANTWSVGTRRAAVHSLENPAVIAVDLTSARVEAFEVTAPDQTLSSASSYAMFVTGSTGIALVNVALRAGNGGAGATSAGVIAAPPAPVPPCASSDGQAAPAAPGAAAGTASYSAGGYSPAKGADGSAGQSGHNGTAAGDRSCASYCEQGCVCQLAHSPTAHCTIGGITSGVICSDSGTNGCGGPGSDGGSGGSGGGASIGLFAWASTITVTDGSITAANGGAGGIGNGAGAAITQWAHRSGIGGNTKVHSSFVCKLSDLCTQAVAGSVTAQGGAAGGDGGQGATGTSGAGGSGGDSYSYYAGGGASVTTSAGTQLTFGSAGIGGSATPPSSAGTNGFAAVTNTAN